MSCLPSLTNHYDSRKVYLFTTFHKTIKIIMHFNSYYVFIGICSWNNNLLFIIFCVTTLNNNRNVDIINMNKLYCPLQKYLNIKIIYLYLSRFFFVKK